MVMLGVLSIAWVLLLMLLTLFGCTEADIINGNAAGGVPPGSVEATFRLEVAPAAAPITRSITFTAQGSQTDTLTVDAAPAPTDGRQTRSATALPDAQEKKVAGLWIGQYDAAGTTLLSHQYLESVAAPEADGAVIVTVKLAKGNSKLRFVANAGNLGAIATEAQLNAKTLSYASTPDGRPQQNLLVMTGSCTADITGTLPAQTLSSVTLTRLAAKITFTYKINGTGFSFAPSAVSLKNVADRSQIGATDLSNPARPTRPADATYTQSYSGTTNTTGATIYWYLPENMAGTGSPSIHSEKEKTGQGVTNATCIELKGTAVQNGVTYENVVFTFYPGKDANDYNIARNDHFIMNIDLRGLDVSDKRITVPTIPAITVTPSGILPSAAGATCEVQITSRAGVVWSLPLPSWLSATIDGQTTPGGTTLTNQGPCTVTFTAETELNANVRSQTFTVDLDGKGQTGSFTLTQIGANVLRIDEDAVEAYKAALKAQNSSSPNFPPFNYDGGKSSGSLGYDIHGNSSAWTLDAPYFIEVSLVQPEMTPYNEAAIAECEKLPGTGWRIPISTELYAIYQNKAGLEKVSDFESFIGTSNNMSYWSSSCTDINDGRDYVRTVIDFFEPPLDTRIGLNITGSGCGIRCVREISN